MAPGIPPVVEQLRRINQLIYRAERAFIVVALLAMAFVVFLDVVHRAFASQDSKVLGAFVKVVGWVGIAIEPGTPGHARAAAAMPWVGFAILSGLGWFGVRTATRTKPVGHGLAAALGVGGTVVAYGLVQLLLRLMPNGLIWSQEFALVLTLWVGFLGASMATYENKHLKVEALQRHIPPGLRRWVAFGSAALTAAVCFALMYLSLRYVRFNYEQYTQSQGQGGLVQGMSLPKYIAFLALPLGFGVMTLRFGGAAAAALQGRIDESDPLAGLVDDATRQAVKAATEVRIEADIPTEAIRPIREQPSPPPRSEPAARAARSGEVVVAQSEVVTDRHAVAEGGDGEPERGES